ncbi:MAG: hypothetical protein AAF740_14375, partial [Bacteroidota bacterium]
FCGQLYAQSPEAYGFRHLQYALEGDTVDVLVKSKKGKEMNKKPLFFFVRGSRAFPLLVHNGKSRTRYSSMVEGFVEEAYHLVLVSKPGIPLLAHEDSLKKGEYFEDTQNFIYPDKYLRHNNLEYYTRRNLQILDSLCSEPWVDTTTLVIAGNSQGSSVALSMADKSTKATHLIYSSGMPYYSTILAIIARARMHEEGKADPKIEKSFRAWREVLDDPYNYENTDRDSNQMLYSFSKQENEVLKRLRIPVLISYGTKDESAPYQDLFRLEVIRERLSHITFLPYVGLGHSYQLKVKPEDENQKIDYLEEVIGDWLYWLKEKP